MLSYIEKKCVEKKLEVIVYGMGNLFEQSYEYIDDRFDIIGCSDSNEKKRYSEITLRIPFYSSNELATVHYDYILITSIYDNEIKDHLIKNITIDSGKILTRKDWYRILIKKSFGNINEDKCFYIMSRPIRKRNGLMSYLFGVLQQLVEIDGKNFIPIVDMQNYPNQYLDDDLINIENSWEYYYDNLSSYQLCEIYNSKHVVLGYDDPNYLNDYKNDYDLEKMHDMYCRYIHIKDNVKKIIDKDYKAILGNYSKPLGVILRGSDMVNLKLKDHPIQPSVNEVIATVHENINEWGCDIIYLCTEDEDIVDVFIREFGNKVVYTKQARFKKTDAQWLADIKLERDNDRYLRGIEYLVTIEILAKCDNMIASICCGSIMAQIIHGSKYENLIVLDKGFYN